MTSLLFSSLRVRLMLLMLAAALPAFAAILYFSFWLHEQSDAHYRTEVRVVADQLAMRHREQIEEIRLLLTTLAHIPEVRAGKGDTCVKLLAEIKSKWPSYLDNLVVVHPNGNILCSAIPSSHVINVAGKEWFQRGMSSPFHVGEYHVSPRTGAAVTTHAMPITENGQVIGLVAASLNLSWVNDHASLNVLPTGMAYAIFDAKGTFLLRLPVDKPRMGKNIGDTQLWRTVASLNQATVFRAIAPDGQAHLFAYAPLGSAKQPYARLLVGVPEALANAESLRLLWVALTTLLLVVLTGYFVGRIGGHRLIVQPLQAVFEAVKQMTAGNLSARSGLTPGFGEISQLANKIDVMAATLEERNKDLQRERDKAQAYLDVVGVMVVMLDKEGRVKLTNRKSCELLGCYPAGSCIGDDWFSQFIPLEDREEMRQKFRRIMDSGDKMPVYHEYMVQTGSGERRLIAWHNTALKDENGQIIGALSAGEDVTALRMMQSEILESRAKYQSLVENIPGAVFRCEINYPWRVEHMSAAVADLCGIQSSHFLDREMSYGKLIHPDDLDQVARAVNHGVNQRQSYQVTYRLLHADGTYRWMLELGRAIHDANSEPQWLDGVILDITAQKEAELALQASEAKYRLLLESIPLVVWQKDRDNVYAACNTAFARARKLSPDQIVGKTDFDIYPHELAEQHRSNDSRMLTGGQSEQYETSWVNCGEARDMLVHKIPLRNSDGEITGTLGVAEDITEYKYMQAERERLRAQLQQAQKMEALGQLTGGIAHDFNNILASVLGFSKLALRRHVPDPNSELADYLREIIAAGERARELVAKMLIFGRSRSAPIMHSLAPLALVSEVVKMLTATIPSSILIETRFEENLPDIAFDPVAFQQVLVNLVINARDAMGDKGKITITLCLRQMDEMECSACRQLFSGSYVELCVTDDGQGIAPDVLPRIFEPFFTTKDVGKGTGMGLSVVHGLVSRASGHFRVASSPGNTQFRVFLPVAVAEQPDFSVSPEADASPANLSTLTGHVLVVDDDSSIRHFLSAALTDAGWEVSAFDSSLLALAAFQDAPDRFDAVITDQTMPGLTGIELVAALHRQRPDLPVILCSGYSESLSDDAAMNSGAQRFMHKPVDIDALLLALAELRSQSAQG